MAYHGIRTVSNGSRAGARARAGRTHRRYAGAGAPHPGRIGQELPYLRFARLLRLAPSHRCCSPSPPIRQTGYLFLHGVLPYGTLLFQRLRARHGALGSAIASLSASCPVVAAGEHAGWPWPFAKKALRQGLYCRGKTHQSRDMDIMSWRQRPNGVGSSSVALGLLGHRQPTPVAAAFATPVIARLAAEGAVI